MVAQLKVVRLADPQRVQRLGDGLVVGGGAATVLGEGQARVRQGALENSNVTSAREMVELMQTMRHFESMQRIAQGYDELLGVAIHKLGDL